MPVCDEPVLGRMWGHHRMVGRMWGHHWMVWSGDFSGRAVTQDATAVRIARSKSAYPPRLIKLRRGYEKARRALGFEREPPRKLG